MQITASKLDEWFFPGPENKLLARDMAGTHEAIEIYKNLISPAIAEHAKKTSEESGVVAEEPETGYKSSERVALENQLMQIETVAQVIEEYESDHPSDDENK
jgi:hypothetical protein